MLPRAIRLARAAALVSVGASVAVVTILATKVVRACVADAHPPRIVARPLAGRAELAGFEEVTFRAADGVLLSGWWRAPQNGAAVVLAHGWGANREQLLPQALPLARAGFGVLVFDLRAHGESGGELSTSGDRERRDVAAALAFTAGRAGVHALGAVGFSIGALATAEVSLGDERVRAVALEAMPEGIDAMVRRDYAYRGALSSRTATWTFRALGIDLDAVRPGARLCGLAPRALLLVYGEKDPEVPLGVGHALRAAACDPAELWVVPGGGHGAWSGAPLEALEERLVRFFEEALLVPRGRGAAHAGAE